MAPFYHPSPIVGNPVVSKELPLKPRSQLTYLATIHMKYALILFISALGYLVRDSYLARKLAISDADQILLKKLDLAPQSPDPSLMAPAAEETRPLEPAQ